MATLETVLSEKDGGLSHQKSQTYMSNNSVTVKIPTFKDTMVNHYFSFLQLPSKYQQYTNTTTNSTHLYFTQQIPKIVYNIST